MYTNISEYFDMIFPLSMPTVHFLLKEFEQVASILDMACGDGKYTIPLSETGKIITGADNNEAMITVAKMHNQSANFHLTDFLSVATEFKQNTFDGIFCIGNSLVHLANEAEIKEALNQLFKILKPGRKCIIQIINYDRIFEHQLHALPTIENGSIRFERLYHYENNQVDFHTRLFDNNELIQEEHQILFGITKQHLETIAINSGFKISKVYGNFNYEDWNIESFHSIFILEK